MREKRSRAKCTTRTSRAASWPPSILCCCYGRPASVAMVISLPVVGGCVGLCNSCLLCTPGQPYGTTAVLPRVSPACHAAPGPGCVAPCCVAAVAPAMLPCLSPACHVAAVTPCPHAPSCVLYTQLAMFQPAAGAGRPAM